MSAYCGRKCNLRWLVISLWNLEQCGHMGVEKLLNEENILWICTPMNVNLYTKIGRPKLEENPKEHFLMLYFF